MTATSAANPAAYRRSMALGLSGLLVGAIVAWRIGAAGCGTWGLDCFFYSLGVLALTGAVCCVFFWRGAAQAPARSPRKYMAVALALLTTLPALAGVIGVLWLAQA